MMHPPDFSLNDNGIYRNNFNEKQINELELLIDDIRNLGLKIVPISEINLDSTRIPNPVLENEQMNLVQVVEKSSQISNCNCVAFSIDSFQDYWINDVQLELLETFEKTDTSVTVGIIGNHFGSDEKLVNFLKDLLNKNEPPIEIANNGWEYEDYTLLTKEEQSSLVKKGNERIENIFGFKSITFLPPYDKINDDTLLALKDNDVNYISSSRFAYSPLYNFTNEQVFHIPYGVTTGKFDPTFNHFLGINQEEIFSKIKQDIEINGFSVVRLNPQEFSMIEEGVHQNKINTNRFVELESILEKVKQSGYNTVLINKISLIQSNNIELPAWIKNNALWWSNNQISETDFVSGIEYMIQKRIIVIPQIPQSESYQSIEVPSWIKNNAGWWGQGLITDADFVGGLEYMIKIGIITI